MSREWANKFYSSFTWKKCRQSFIAYKRGLCEKCLARGMIVSGNHVHHKVFLTPDNINDPSVTCNFENLMLLCEKCHEEIHHETAHKQRFSVGRDGKVTSRETDVR